MIEKQRHDADNADKKMDSIFYKMMKETGQEVHCLTGALVIPRTAMNIPTIFDICMAPGGFLATTLDMNPGAHATRFSLPVVKGGHKVLMHGYPKVTSCAMVRSSVPGPDSCRAPRESTNSQANCQPSGSWS